LYLLLGETQLQNKQPDEAEKALARAVEIDKQNVNALVLLAQVEIAQGSTGQAVSNYKRAIDVAPNMPQLHVALGAFMKSKETGKQPSLYIKKLWHSNPIILLPRITSLISCWNTVAA